MKEEWKQYKTCHHEEINAFGQELTRQKRELVTLSQKEGEKYSMIEGSCTIWQGSMKRLTPIWYYKGQQIYVRPFVYKARKGLIPSGFYVVMSCKTIGCIHSEHMEIKSNLRPISSAE